MKGRKKKKREPSVIWQKHTSLAYKQARKRTDSFLFLQRRGIKIHFYTWDIEEKEEKEEEKLFGTFFSLRI